MPLNPFVVNVPEDRSLSVPPRYIVKTQYVQIDDIVLDNKTSMAIGNVEKAMQRLMSVVPNQPFPCPNGAWDDNRTLFHIKDGRHTYVAALMLGFTHLLVAYIAGVEE